MLTEAESLYAAILAHPDEDTPRMMLADELEESDPERADFIRVQVALARNPQTTLQCPHCASDDGYNHNTGCLYSREYELLTAHRREWLTVRCDKCWPEPGSGRGHYNVEKTCSWCRGTGDAGRLTWQMPHPDSGGGIRHSPEVTFARGFPHRVIVPRLLPDCVEIGCSECVTAPVGHRCVGCGRLSISEPTIPSEWLAAVVRHHPTLAHCVPLDRDPYWNGGGYCWFNANHSHASGSVPEAAELPETLFIFMRNRAGFMDGSRMLGYSEKARAVRELAETIVAFAKV